MSQFKFSFTKSLSTKLISLFLLISIIPLLIIGILSIRNSQSALQDAAFLQLQTEGILKANKTVTFLDDKFDELEILVKSEDIAVAVNKLKDYHDTGGVAADGEFIIDNQRYNNIYAEITPFFNQFVETFQYTDVFLICEAHGHVMYTSARKENLGINLGTLKYKASGLAELWQIITDTKKPTMVDYRFSITLQQETAFIGTPVFDAENNLIAVVALQLNVELFDGIMNIDVGQHDYNETYLIGNDFLMRSNSRLSEQKTILKTNAETESAVLALQNKSGFHITNDYNDISVLTYYENLDLRNRFGTNFDWAIISTDSEAGALASAHSLRKKILIIALIISILVAIFAFYFSGLITRPLIKLTESTNAAAIGDLSIKVETDLKDEIGALVSSFNTFQDNILEKAEQANQIAAGNLNIDVKPVSDKDTMGIAFSKMVDMLRNQITEITEGVNVLSASASEIMTTVAQLAAGAAETATSVNETTSTIEEVKQTAEISHQKANQVSELSQKTREVADSGNKSIEETIDGMDNIKLQMESIADIVIRLSEQSATVSEITSSVNDIAEQSNLLAVNASIEAAKAGEQGRGFAVVAQEIKNLAEQSKQSTSQISTILNDIQKSISNAVLTTEQATKAVDEGMKLSETAGTVISTLASSVEEAAQASLQIASSSQQQLVGMDQVTTAMESINEASVQTASSTRQSEESVTELHNLGEKLKQILSLYKLDK